MLVLSRRKNEVIRFPELGISVKVAQISGKSVRLAIDAPSQVQVLRGEVQPKSPSKPSATHELRNRLNELTLAMQLYQRQQEGTDTKSDELAQKIAATLQQLHKDVQTNQAHDQRKILVVEDNPNERELLSALLKWNGAEVFTATDGQDALEQLQNGLKPDYILMDIRMPRLSGEQTIREIRSNPSTSQLPIFAMSGCARSDFNLDNGPEGINEWFAKPINTAQVWERIQRQADNNHN